MVDVVAALIWRGEAFLICQRPAGKARGLLWEFAGGKVEPVSYTHLQWHEPGAVPPESRASETLAPRQLREALLQAREEPADEKLAAALAWRYPYAEAAEAPLKLTITGLVREIEGPAVRQELVERPAFLSEGQPSAAQRGTEVHRLLEMCIRDSPWTKRCLRITSSR